MSLTIHPVTRERWPDLNRLFSADWQKGAGEPNRQAMRQFVESGQVPGILAYIDGEPAGWCSVAPRPTLVGLKQFGQYRRFENPEVWVINCFYVPESHRGLGLMGRLLEAAVQYAAANGARVVEAYPFEAAYADDGAGGTLEVFARAGFVEVTRISEHQAVMRYRIDNGYGNG